MPIGIDPEPSDAEREAILVVLAAREEGSEWADAALLEGVEADELEP